MSLWSVIAVDLLDVQPDSHFLDLSSAPGMKFVYASLLMASKRMGSLPADDRFSAAASYSSTGVDISRERQFVTKNMVKKYKVDRVRLLVGRGEHFMPTPCQGKAFSLPILYSSSALRRSKEPPSLLYDRILVDPECSGTSTVKSISRAKETEKTQTSAMSSSAYTIVQSALMERAYLLLSPGGIIVYSTCTFNHEENEGVIGSFLAGHPDMVRIPIEDHVRRIYGVSTRNARPENISALLSTGDTLFVSKLQKTKESCPQSARIQPLLL